MRAREKVGRSVAQKDDRKRLGKKHRQASTRPKKGSSPKVHPDDRGGRPAQTKDPFHQARRQSTGLRELQSSPLTGRSGKSIRPDGATSQKTRGEQFVQSLRDPPTELSDDRPRVQHNVAGRERIEDDWRDIELLASQMVTETESSRCARTAVDCDLWPAERG